MHCCLILFEGFRPNWYSESRACVTAMLMCVSFMWIVYYLSCVRDVYTYLYFLTLCLSVSFLSVCVTQFPPPKYKALVCKRIFSFPSPPSSAEVHRAQDG